MVLRLSAIHMQYADSSLPLKVSWHTSEGRFRIAKLGKLVLCPPSREASPNQQARMLGRRLLLGLRGYQGMGMHTITHLVVEALVGRQNKNEKITCAPKHTRYCRQPVGFQTKTIVKCWAVRRTLWQARREVAAMQSRCAGSRKLCCIPLLSPR